MTKNKNNKAIHIILWIAQGLMAAMFIMAGAMKASQPLEVLAASMPWISATPSALVRFIGVSELLGGIGLILPALLRIKPFLTSWAAIGLVIVMFLAAIVHATRGEFSSIGVNVFVIAICGFIAWGRSSKAPIPAKA